IHPVSFAPFAYTALHRGDGGKMEAAGDVFHGARQQHGIRNITDQQLGAGREVLPPARGQIVQHSHALPRRDKRGAKMRTDESTATGDQPKLHAAPLLAARTWPKSSAWPRVVSSQPNRSAWARVARREGGSAS